MWQKGFNHNLSVSLWQLSIQSHSLWANLSPSSFLWARPKTIACPRSSTERNLKLQCLSKSCRSLWHTLQINWPSLLLHKKIKESTWWVWYWPMRGKRRRSTRCLSRFKVKNVLTSGRQSKSDRCRYRFTTIRVSVSTYPTYQKKLKLCSRNYARKWPKIPF